METYYQSSDITLAIATADIVSYNKFSYYHHWLVHRLPTSQQVSLTPATGKRAGPRRQVTAIHNTAPPRDLSAAPRP